jgi:hypothetical protein
MVTMNSLATTSEAAEGRTNLACARSLIVEAVCRVGVCVVCADVVRCWGSMHNTHNMSPHVGRQHATAPAAVKHSCEGNPQQARTVNAHARAHCHSLNAWTLAGLAAWMSAAPALSERVCTRRTPTVCAEATQASSKKQNALIMAIVRRLRWHARAIAALSLGAFARVEGGAICEWRLDVRA